MVEERRCCWGTEDAWTVRTFHQGRICQPYRTSGALGDEKGRGGKGEKLQGSSLAGDSVGVVRGQYLRTGGRHDPNRQMGARHAPACAPVTS